MTARPDAPAPPPAVPARPRPVGTPARPLDEETAPLDLRAVEALLSTPPSGLPTTGGPPRDAVVPVRETVRRPGDGPRAEPVQRWSPTGPLPAAPTGRGRPAPGPTRPDRSSPTRPVPVPDARATGPMRPITPPPDRPLPLRPRHPAGHAVGEPRPDAVPRAHTDRGRTSPPSFDMELLASIVVTSGADTLRLPAARRTTTPPDQPAPVSAAPVSAAPVSTPPAPPGPDPVGPETRGLEQVDLPDPVTPATETAEQQVLAPEPPTPELPAPPPRRAVDKEWVQRYRRRLEPVDADTTALETAGPRPTFPDPGPDAAPAAPAAPPAAGPVPAPPAAVDLGRVRIAPGREPIWSEPADLEPADLEPADLEPAHLEPGDLEPAALELPPAGPPTVRRVPLQLDLTGPDPVEPAEPEPAGVDLAELLPDGYRPAVDPEPDEVAPAPEPPTPAPAAPRRRARTLVGVGGAVCITAGLALLGAAAGRPVDTGDVPSAVSRPLLSPAVAPASAVGVVPAKVVLPARGVTAPVVPVTTGPDGGLAVPDPPTTVGWWTPSPLPGGPSGTTVLAGHVDSRVAGFGAFAVLRDMAVGEQVDIVGADGRTVTFAVVARREYVKAVLPVDDLFGSSGGPPRLVLITCGGAFDKVTRSYDSNVVVYAVPTGDVPPPANPTPAS